MMSSTVKNGIDRLRKGNQRQRPHVQLSAAFLLLANQRIENQSQEMLTSTFAGFPHFSHTIREQPRGKFDIFVVLLTTTETGTAKEGLDGEN